ncbi:hypothetical protein [Sulfitobacter mediterraneus]|uniref:hypothetical protein n=1 Tax=Sulfitobacter mediterraneus TaxID=83219 RepID=UPI0012DCA5C8|nr:hypothetical protein [Sulfitobacter mediterraneus]
MFWIVGNLDPSKVGARRLEAFDLDHLEVLNEIVGRFEHHVSTLNVLTEASNLIGAGRQQLCKGAANRLGRYIEYLEEIYVPSSDTLSKPFYSSLGLADAGLAAISRNGDIVLTADGPLYGAMSGRGVKIENFWHYAVLK